MGRPGCLLEAPGAPREARPPKAAQRHSKETVWVVRGCLLEVSGPPLGGLRAPKGTPKSLQGRGQYEASYLKLTQTKTSELKLHKFFPQGHWSSRAEAELAKRKQFIRLGDMPWPYRDLDLSNSLIQVPLRSGQVCFYFGSLASYRPRPWSDFGVPLGAGKPPK